MAEKAEKIYSNEWPRIKPTEIAQIFNFFEQLKIFNLLPQCSSIQQYLIFSVSYNTIVNLSRVWNSVPGEFVIVSPHRFRLDQESHFPRLIGSRPSHAIAP